MKVERYEDETDEDWAERLAEETAIANDTETTHYMVHQDSYTEDGLIIEYIGKDSWTWKEHPDGMFTCKQVLDWKKKAEQWDRVKPHLESLVEDWDELMKLIRV